MFSVKTNIPVVMNKLQRLRLLIDGGWQQDQVRVFEKTKDAVAQLTPKSSKNKVESFTIFRDKKTGQKRTRYKTTEHLRDGWKLRVIGGGGKGRAPVLAVIYNEQTHKADGTQKRKAILGEGGFGVYTLLDILEYGSRSHTIVPLGSFKGSKHGKLPKSLRFEIGGKVVYARRVHHPGTKPYGMVRKARVFLARMLVKLNRAWANKISREFAK